MNKTLVVNCRKDKYDVFIGRPSKWGNPYKIGINGTRDEVIEKYREYLKTNKILLDQLYKLKGKRLGCFCAPLKCHGHILLEFLEKQGE
jgi:hypothetical protein